jgi:hypothetical protein
LPRRFADRQYCVEHGAVKIRAVPETGTLNNMHAPNNIRLDAEEQLMFGTKLWEMRAARNNLRQAVPGCLLLELLEAKIARMEAADWPDVSPWSA